MDQRISRLALFVRATLASASAFVLPNTASAQAGVRPSADFNADGYGDIAIGVPNETIVCSRLMQSQAAGVAHVVYGKSPAKGSSPRTFTNQLLARPCGIRTKVGANAYARFGTALAHGDFNSDGFDDLAVGVPNENSLTGSVDIYSGSANGLTRTSTITKALIPGANAMTCLNFNNVGDSFPAPDLLGLALAADDIDQDGYADLAIASSCVSGISGAVHVVMGSAQGLDPAGPSTRTYPFTNTVPATMVFGDFDQNGYPDLAIGAPVDFSWWYTYAAQGHVLVQYGSPAGLSSTPQHLSSAIAGLPHSQPIANDDRFGHSLATADFNLDGYADLAIGVPGKNDGAGVVHVLFGSASRLTTQGAITWSQSTQPTIDYPEAADGAGMSLTVGRFDSDSIPELAIGVPGEDGSRGVVHVVTFASDSTIAAQQRWRQGNDGITDLGEINDRFGNALTTTDLDGDGIGDLAIAAPGENARSGLVNLIFGGSFGLTATGNWILRQGFDTLLETPEQNDEFGRF